MGKRAISDKEGERRISAWLEGASWNMGQKRAMTALERQHKHREAEREIAQDFADACLRIDWKRRRASLADPRQFIVNYCMDFDGIFKFEPYAETDAIIDVMLSAASSSTPYHLRITRGGGKTTLFIWLAVYLICRHEKSFIVLTTSKMDLAKPMIDDIANLFTSSPNLIQDFPELSLPLVMLGGSMQRAASQRFMGRPTLCRVTNSSIRFPVLGGCPLLKGFEGGAIVMANGFNGKARGIRIGKRRPDFILLDDLQDDEMAKRQERIEDARQKIYKTYFNLGSAEEKPSVLMASTAIQPDDLSELIANDPNWKTETFPMMLSMPSASAMVLWQQYKLIRAADITEGRFDEHNELKFYIEHRAEMDDGAKAFWHDCYLKDGTEISAVQHAMNKFLRDEDSFMSECQMLPRRASVALDLPSSTVQTRILPGSAKFVVPTGFVFVAAATDINPSYALTTSIVAFRRDRTGLVVSHPLAKITIGGALNDTSFFDLVYKALLKHGEALRATGIRINAWGIDAGGRQFKPVTAFAKHAAAFPSVRIPCCAMMGVAHHRLNLMPRNRIADPIDHTVLVGDNLELAGLAQHKAGLGARWVRWDGDIYREAVQRAFLTEVGAPGGCSLYDPRGDRTAHIEFADQVTNEKLKNKLKHGENEEYVWSSEGRHDYLDAMGMCYAIAAIHGYSGGGIANARPLVKRKPKIIIK